MSSVPSGFDPAVTAEPVVTKLQDVSECTAVIVDCQGHSRGTQEPAEVKRKRTEALESNCPSTRCQTYPPLRGSNQIALCYTVT